jgi:hypothetical protein
MLLLDWREAASATARRKVRIWKLETAIIFAVYGMNMARNRWRDRLRWACTKESGGAEVEREAVGGEAKGPHSNWSSLSAPPCSTPDYVPVRRCCLEQHFRIIKLCCSSNVLPTLSSLRICQMIPAISSDLSLVGNRSVSRTEHTRIFQIYQSHMQY